MLCGPSFFSKISFFLKCLNCFFFLKCQYFLFKLNFKILEILEKNQKVEICIMIRGAIGAISPPQAIFFTFICSKYNQKQCIYAYLNVFSAFFADFQLFLVELKNIGEIWGDPPEGPHNKPHPY